MPTGPEVNNDFNRNQRLSMQGIASEIGAATATSGTATLSDLMGKVTTDASSAAADATYTLTLTNTKVAAGDMAFASVTLSSGTAAGVAVKDVLCGSETLTIVLVNTDADTAWSSAAFIISYMVIKGL